MVKQYSEVDMGYELIGTIYTNPNGMIRQKTVGNIGDYSGYITYANLNEFNRHSSRILDD
ncbi:hypothetical protein EL17_06065 [Anditalea andensis]|uniref:Uncharacterized protein n=2 Tax=Anditalea andensis TaxID=1048983 RepID=A0A074L240_9BACT|nr:hypothetical protein EL17_06065 [Anditalea andensis]